MKIRRQLVVLTALLAAGSAYAFTGPATIYSLGSGNGSCDFGPGNRAPYVVALNTGMGDSQYQDGRNCGRFIQINYKGKSVNAEVVDRCADGSAWCNQDPTHIDMDEATAKAIGRTYGTPNDNVEWHFISAPSSSKSCAYVSANWGDTWAIAMRNTYQGIGSVQYADSKDGPYQAAQWETGGGNQHTARFKVKSKNGIVFIRAFNAKGQAIQFAGGSTTTELTAGTTHCS